MASCVLEEGEEEGEEDGCSNDGDLESVVFQRRRDDLELAMCHVGLPTLEAADIAVVEVERESISLILVGRLVARVEDCRRILWMIIVPTDDMLEQALAVCLGLMSFCISFCIINAFRLFPSSVQNLPFRCANEGAVVVVCLWSVAFFVWPGERESTGSLYSTGNR